MNNKLLQQTIGVTLLWLLSLSTYAATNVNAHLDRQQINLGETVKLILSTNTRKINSSPDFSILKDHFTIISTGENNNISVINGKTAYLTQWIVTLMPKHSGEIIVPAINVGKDKTTPQKLQVVKYNNQSKQQFQHIYLEATATPKNPWQNSQVIYTIKLFYDQNVQNAKFTEPNLEDAQFLHLNNDKSYQKIINKQVYQILERQYALFPEKSGILTIPGPQFTGSILENSTNNSDPLQFFTNKWQEVKANANNIQLNVKMPPANIKTVPWLPAQNLTIRETWSKVPTKFYVGQPITRSIIIEAVGLTAEQLPSVAAFQPKQFKVYPDKPTFKTTISGSNIISKKIEKFAFIPNESGETKLPPIKIYWWDINTNTMRLANIASKKINVAAANTTNLNNIPSSHITPIKKDINKNLSQHYPRSKSKINIWIILFVIVLILWIITIACWWRYHQQRTSLQQQCKQQFNKNIAQARKQVKQACMRNDPQLCKTALITWAKMLWPQQTFNNLGDIRKIVVAESCKEALCSLDMHLYTLDSEKNWDGKQCWKILEKTFKPNNSESKTINNTLPPLYPD